MDGGGLGHGAGGEQGQALPTSPLQQLEQSQSPCLILLLLFCPSWDYPGLSALWAGHSYSGRTGHSAPPAKSLTPLHIPQASQRLKDLKATAPGLLPAVHFRKGLPDP